MYLTKEIKEEIFKHGEKQTLETIHIRTFEIVMIITQSVASR
jgi:hypothetical protein